MTALTGAPVGARQAMGLGRADRPATFERGRCPVTADATVERQAMRRTCAS